MIEINVRKEEDTKTQSEEEERDRHYLPSQSSHHKPLRELLYVGVHFLLGDLIVEIFLVVTTSRPKMLTLRSRSLRHFVRIWKI